MPKSIYYKIRLLLSFSFIFYSFSSCQIEVSDELKTFTAFLETNHAFNIIGLNRAKAIYFKKSKEIPIIHSEKLNTINVAYERLMLKIDRSITVKETSIEPLIQEYDNFFTEIKTLFLSLYNLPTHYRKKLAPHITAMNDINFNTEYRLKAMKNSLTLSMIFAYQSIYGSLVTTSVCGIIRVRINTAVALHENLAKITLKSALIQTVEEEKNISIDKITVNGIDKKLKYNIAKNQNFTDIILDSLAPGTYQIEGKVQYFDRNGKKDIPFRETFEVK
ncbi:hypothetical protein [uncultured Kordia sp.]|uniref:hypothetical protein n=1 Tax=uncultured Kordia sp. TaxID=507699 RepID=UPI00262DAF49|nr:hypothetical protein [uncultured Kordia sp.]